MKVFCVDVEYVYNRHTGVGNIYVYGKKLKDWSLWRKNFIVGNEVRPSNQAPEEEYESCEVRVTDWTPSFYADSKMVGQIMSFLAEECSVFTKPVRRRLRWTP